MRDCKITKKALSVLLALSMVLSWTPIPTHAADVDTCTHHAEHTADCGYVAAVAGSPCTHVCGETCVESCVHSAHDDTCGYIVGTEGTPCAYDCQEDHGTVTEQPEATTEPSVPETTEDAAPETTEGETIPETTEGETVIANQSTDWCGNPLCSQEDAFHVTSCTQYVAPENPECYCVEKCTEINVWCDICGFDYTQCGGTDTAAVYADCAHTTVTDGICVDCKLYGYCGASGSESNVTWTFDESTGTLTISGTGAMADYEELGTHPNWYTNTPWYVYRDSITNIVVTGNITYIGQVAFAYMDAAKTIDLSTVNGLTTIGVCAFLECGIESIQIPDSVTTMDYGAFYDCGLKSIELPPLLKRIEECLLRDCESLTEVIIPSSVEYMGGYAFDGCTSLAYLEIPASVKTMDHCFLGWDSNSSGSGSIPITIRYLGETDPNTNIYGCYYAKTVYVPCTYKNDTFGNTTVTIGHFDAETGKSNLTYSVSGNSIVQHCSKCGDDTATLVIEENKEYDGENKVSVVYTDGWIGGELDVIEAIQPDIYTASISYDELTVSETFEITKNQLTITAKDQAITYGGSIAFGADQVDAVLGTGDTLTITLTPSTDKATDNGTITPSDAKITNASGVDVTDNYIITYETGKLIINKSEPVIIFNAEYTPSKTYDGNAVEEPTVEDVTVTGIYEAPVVFTWYKDSVSEGKELSAAPTDAGTYILVASIAETSNTGATSIELNVTISQADASVTEAPKVVSGLIYTGASQELVSGGKVEGGTLVYSNTQDGTYAETITGTDAGSYEVWYKVRGDANHADTEPVKLSTVEIAQADASNAAVTFTRDFSYTGKEIFPSADEVIVKLNGVELIYETDYTFIVNSNTEVGTDVTVTITFTGNYTGTATGKFTIIPCPHSGFEDKKCTQCGGVCGDVVDHDYDNGICVNGCYQPAADENQDGTYEISNAGQLYWFAGLINGILSDKEQDTAAYAVLTANITMPANKSWTPIGINGDYAGTFDGQNHTISGLYFKDTSAEYVGLFSRINNGTVKNVGIVNAQFEGSSYIGGISGYTMAVTIENCYVTGNISGTGTLGGIVAWPSKGSSLKNCYFSGSIGNGTVTSDIAGDGTRADFSNCYYLADSDTHDDGLSGTTAKTATQFASGEVAYLLQGSQTTEIWGQTIGTDSYPVLGGTKVYQVTDCKGGSNGYSNDSTATGVHNYVNGTCTICGDTIELISVDITWGAMEFTYTDGAWNAETHSYGEGSWSDNGTGWVNVKNSGNVAVTVTYDYDTERTDITGSFTDGTNAITTSVTLPAGEEKKAWIVLNGKPSTALNGETIGTVTVTIGR